MNRRDLVRLIASGSDMAPSVAADQLDHAVELILSKLRDGTAVPLPGIGVLEPGKAKVKLRSPQGRRKEVRSK